LQGGDMELEREPLTSVLGGVVHICGQADSPLTATFRYVLEDAAAVSVDFEAANKQTWRFARDLLREPFIRPDVEHGVGDIRAAYHAEHGIFRLTLHGVDGRCMIYLDAQAVAEFVEQVYELVPMGADVVDVEGLLGEIL
jgi:hypothetical protein